MQGANQEHQAVANPATTLFDTGYRDVIPVAPPNAEISRQSSLKAATLGKTPAKRGPQGWYGFKDWPSHKSTAADAAEWDRWGANVGLRAATFPAVDIDFDDERLASEIAELAVQQLGPAPIRRSRKGRRLLVYRTEEPFGKRRASFRLGDTSQAVEVLGSGQQYVVSGGHPSGEQYRWERTPLVENLPQDLTCVTAEQMDGFLNAVGELLGRKGWQVERSSTDTSEGRPPLTQEQLKEIAAPGESEEERRRWADEAAEALKEDERYGEYDEWQTLARILRQAYGPGLEGEAEEKFHDLSETFPSYDPEEVQRVWSALGTDTTPMGYDVLLARARERGYELPQDHPRHAANEFPVDEELSQTVAELKAEAGEDAPAYAAALDAIRLLGKLSHEHPTFPAALARAKQAIQAVPSYSHRSVAQALLFDRLEQRFGRAAHDLLRPAGEADHRMQPFQWEDGRRILRAADPADWVLSDRYLVDGYVPAGSVGEVIADFGCGKTWLLLEIALSVAFGLPALGRPTVQQPVLYLAYEGQAGIWGRCFGWLRQRDLLPSTSTRAALAEVLQGRFTLAAAPPRFDHHDLEASLVDTISHRGIGLVVIDTRAKSLGAEQSEDSNDTASFINGTFSRIAAETDCSFLSAHHTGHADKGRGRGASAWTQGVDFSYTVKGTATDVGDGAPVTLTPGKMRDDVWPNPITYKLIGVPDLTLDGTRLDSGALELVKPPHVLSLFERILAEIARLPGRTKNQVATAVGGKKQVVLQEMESLINAGRLLDSGSPLKSSLYIAPPGSEFITPEAA